MKIEYLTDDWVPAILLRPDEPNGRGILALHQTTEHGALEPAGMAGDSELAYGLELVQRGYTVLCPNYPGFGDYNCDPYLMGYASATAKGIANHKRGLDLLVQLGCESVAAIGHSLGGHNALFLAAHDDRLSAAVSSCGFTEWNYYMGGDLSGWSTPDYMPLIAGRSSSEMPFTWRNLLSRIQCPVFVSAPENDPNFNADGVRVALAGLGHVQSIHPNIGHSFSASAREWAYGSISSAFDRYRKSLR